ncbi:Hypothetical predicted protein [Olea europaea subsp. europaea]|uniref:Uncharacterized protein n=1 Tax=Olea europaea subsp. europaea TaxID=158383 RepID=A0A8S0SQZ3_OLEEU|nr:Hypothetical predicted protein [Olea europaea subsp. europaea]
MNHQRQRMAEDGGGEAIVCNGKSCQSCTAGMIADCIAVCCCPCVVVNILAFAFLKLPWMVARKYLGLGKKRECEMIYGHNGRETYETWEKGTGDEGSLKIVGEEETMNRAFEEEEVWLELYKIRAEIVTCERLQILAHAGMWIVNWANSLGCVVHAALGHE